MISKGELNIYKALYLNKDGMYIREISRSTKLTLPAIVKHVNNGERIGTIYCKIKGRMKICRVNFSNRKLLPILQEVELTRFSKIPETVQDSCYSFIGDLTEKPLTALIFGSYATGKYTKNSDFDVLLVLQRIVNKLAKSIEFSAAKIKGRTGVNIQPVILDYMEFQKELLDIENQFMKDIKKYALIIYGLDTYIDIIRRLL